RDRLGYNKPRGCSLKWLESLSAQHGWVLSILKNAFPAQSNRQCRAEEVAPRNECRQDPAARPSHWGLSIRITGSQNKCSACRNRVCERALSTTVEFHGHRIAVAVEDVNSTC